MRGQIVLVMAFTLAMAGASPLGAQTARVPTLGRPNGGWLVQRTPPRTTGIEPIRMRRSFGSGTLIGASAGALLGGLAGYQLWKRTAHESSSPVVSVIGTAAIGAVVGGLIGYILDDTR